MITTADRLAPGESGYIEKLLVSGARRSRLLDAEALAALVGHSLTVDDALTLRGLAELYRINQKPRRA